ncbi:hypothetical protein CHH28_17420 [Bacterioplanes sanyensis]|uniref:Uncharacterized protein n=1 Tax=Bacterioplanes sanyensis TaxID=1249553 RepID=A0A222FP85_9GAMM|nr:hypothetical protein [Bacterioplanes sanyensis]ASP40346.1 hypothetical protein CHH28_17420 [Bacterioplanes sanyensis]
MQILICNAPQIDANGYASCAAWQLADYESLVQQPDLTQLSTLFTEFDPALFGMMLTAFMVTFAAGHGVGIVSRLMQRT